MNSMNIQSLSKSAKLAMDTILQKPTSGIPTWGVHIMEHEYIERQAGVLPGEYKRKPRQTYLAMQRAIGTCMIDQYIPENPLTMGTHGYEKGTERKAITGAENIVLDGMTIDSPEAVVGHMEKFLFPQINKDIEQFDESTTINKILQREADIQNEFGEDILKAPYDCISFPCLRYFEYGYQNYLMAYAIYPEIIEKDFSLQADFARLKNPAVARAYSQGNLPPIERLDCDMADSRGMLVDIKSLDRIWFPHFARSLESILNTDIRMIWHCDGNLMEMLPRLVDAGIKGFQGFQYEDGMDYAKICRMKTPTGDDLIIFAGVSVTRTLPQGAPDDVKRELKWLVENGPNTGMFLACSSSIAPGVPWENIKTMVEGLKYYREGENV
ncbi:MAG: uroporphyrinogen decarboxylase family protein [Sedimentisphaerales bacterium]